MPEGHQKWDSLGIGIATFATILAAATSAGIFAVAGRQENYPEWTLALTAILATVSLLGYLFVTVFALATLFRETPQAKRTQTVLTSFAVVVQTYSAVIAVFLVIYSQFF